jgi:hypothetical protein
MSSTPKQDDAITTGAAGGPAPSCGSVVLSYGGGRQTVAICVLVARGVLPRPDVIVMADTGRENPSTWEYLNQHVEPFLSKHDLRVEIAPHSLATVDLYSGNGDLLLPVFTATGKLRTYCSNEWKRRVVDRYLRAKGIEGGTQWIGFGFDEKRRWAGMHGRTEGKWTKVCPLVDLMVNTAACLKIIESAGLPQPHHSACWMCPHKRNAEWRLIRDQYPEEWAKAVAIDKEIRENDGQGGVFLHHDRVPLDQANIDAEEPEGKIQQCTLGVCFV